MPTFGNLTAILIDASPVIMATEPCVSLGAGVYQIINAVKQIIDPRADVIVFVDGDPVAPSAFTVNYVFGKITLVSGVAGLTVTVSARYVPTVPVLGAREFDLETSADLQDVTVFGDTSKRNKHGLKDFSGSVSSLEKLIKNNGGLVKLRQRIDAGIPTLVQIRAAPDDPEIFRGWALLESGSEKASIDGLVESEISFSGTALTGFGRSESAVFGWSN